MDFQYNELRKNIERGNDVFLSERTHLGLSVVVCGQVGWRSRTVAGNGDRSL